MNVNEEKAEGRRKQNRIELRFSSIANMDHRDDPLPEMISLMRDLFEYVKAIDKRQLALLARKAED